MSITSQRNTKRPRQTKISQLEVSVLINEQVLRLQVAMQYPTRVTILNALNQIQHKLLHDLLAHSQVSYGRSSSSWKRLSATAVCDRERVHVLFEIKVEKFHDEVELVAVGVNNIQEADDVGVVKLSQDGNLANGGAGNAFVFGLETDLFESDDAAIVAEITGFVDNTIST
jgi:hypothetical protein